ncbi:hypothetical protein BKI52_23340 [marine bacterium AO1-C]|nr:hypothetical protein BKI52_23340 [marine bacterium AO1-C]
MQTQLSTVNYDTKKPLQTTKVDYNELFSYYLKKMQWQEEQSIQQCMDDLLSELIPFLGGISATLYLAYPETKTLAYLAGYGVDAQGANKEIIYGQELVGQVAKTKKSIYQHYENDARLFSATVKVSIKGVLVIPILANQELTGVMEIVLAKPVTEQKFKFLQQLGQHIGSNLKIRRQEQALRVKNIELEQKNANITSSIKYACTIQQAILPTKAFLDETLGDHFLIYQPKDLVSGDFYWVSDVTKNVKDKKQLNKRLVVAVMDCTGHGVPGSMMSMVGNTLLNQIVKEQHKHNPAKILIELHYKIQEALRQEESENHDGMDGGICVLDFLKNGDVKMTYAGAKRSLAIAKPQLQAVEVIKGDRTSLGGLHHPDQIGIKNQTVMLQKGDMLYLTTDGFEDACCPLRKKYKFKRLMQDIQEIMHEPLTKQREILLQNLQNHKQGVPQRDDITLLGLKL